MLFSVQGGPQQPLPYFLQGGPHLAHLQATGSVQRVMQPRE